MPRKKRDYKAEYAADKRRATRAGYKSQREYKAVRKQLGIPRNASPVPKVVRDRQAVKPSAMPSRMRRIRRECQKWSDEHSRVTNSRFDPDMSDSAVELYHHAFVEPLAEVDQDTTLAKLSRIRAYMKPTFGWSEDDWAANPSTVPLRR